MVYQLDEELWFPHPSQADDDGLIAIGGDLSVDRLLLAYLYGIFPWYAFRQKQIKWYCPKLRFVIFPNEIHISHSMRALINKNIYRVSFNEDFDGVISNCSKLRIDDEYAWLGPEMVDAYKELHRRNYAISVEVWQDERLVGGLYGVNIGQAFFGESMFSLVPSASKMALIRLAQAMQQAGGTIIDCQFETPHLRSMGGRYISYEEFLKLIPSHIDP